MNINKLDLNLLKTVHTLLAEGSVSRAADRLNLTQPAISHALARAREAFGDELLVREKGRMIPTPFAHRIRGRLSAVLQEIQGILDEDSQRLVDIDMTLNIGMTDYTHILFFEKIYAALSALSKNVRIVSRQVSHHDLPSDLATGKIDLALGFKTRDFETLHEDLLFEDHYVCLVKKGFAGGLSLDSYVEGRHVMISYDGQLSGNADEALKRIGRRRHVVVSTPHVFAAASLVVNHGFIMTCPASIAKTLLAGYPIRRARVPFEMPGLPLAMHWHERANADAASAWVREVIRDIVLKESAHGF